MSFFTKTIILLPLVWLCLLDINGYSYANGPYAKGERDIRNIAVKDDRIEFARITACWRNAFPGNTFEGLEIRWVDGPRGRLRLHIPVPKTIEAAYQHAFSVPFLKSQAKSKDRLERIIALDLLKIGKGVIFKMDRLSVSLDGLKHIDCIAYLVPHD